MFIDGVRQRVQLRPGVVLSQFVLVAKHAFTGDRRVVAWAEGMSDRDSLGVMQEWFAFCASVNELPEGCRWELQDAEPGDVPTERQTND